MLGWTGIKEPEEKVEGDSCGKQEPVFPGTTGPGRNKWLEREEQNAE